jgi:hypothetical protein
VKHKSNSEKSFSDKKSNSNKVKAARLSESESSSSWENKTDIVINTQNPEKRLKLTIRVKRTSPEYVTADSEPEYEILRTEGIEGFSDHSSEVSTASKQKKRRKHKKNKYTRDRDMKDNHICHQIDEQAIQIPTKRVKLLFGENEMKILNIPSTVESFSNESDVRIKSNSNLLPAHQNNILVTNVFT